MNKKKAVMTVDVEEYFQVGAFERVVDQKDWWEKYPSRLERQLPVIMELFEKHDVKATFFVLSSVAEKPAISPLIKEIHKLGHEIASHGHAHQRVNQLSESDFERDLLRSKRTLEDLIGFEVSGYRAPSFSVTELSHFQSIRNAGYAYSSSTYPISHDHYGDPDGKILPYEPVNGLLEIPQCVLSLMSKNIPVGGGGYFRLMPWVISKWAITKHMKVHDENKPYMFYFHPWEIDPGQPVISDAPMKSKLRHYVNLNKMLPKLDALARCAQWRSISELYMIQR